MRRSAAQIYSLAVGAALVLGGIVGFLYSADFSTGEATLSPENREAALGLLDVNGWHNAFHVASGVLGLLAAGSLRGARTYAVGLGIVYLGIFFLGLAEGDGGSIFNLIPVNAEDNALHLAIALAGIVTGLASPGAPAPTTVAEGRP
jgi:hypothetical protein